MRERDRLRARRPLDLEGESSIADFFCFLGARISSSESDILTQSKNQLYDAVTLARTIARRGSVSPGESYAPAYAHIRISRCRRGSHTASSRPPLRKENSL